MKTNLSDGSLPFAAPALSAALLGFLLLLRFGYLVYVRHSILRLVLICRGHAFISEGKAQCAHGQEHCCRPEVEQRGPRTGTTWQMFVHAHTHIRTP